MTSSESTDYIVVCDICGEDPGDQFIIGSVYVSGEWDDIMTFCYDCVEDDE